MFETTTVEETGAGGDMVGATAHTVLALIGVGIPRLGTGADRCTLVVLLFYMSFVMFKDNKVRDALTAIVLWEYTTGIKRHFVRVCAKGDCLQTAAIG